jgi:hypothetical protein
VIIPLSVGALWLLAAGLYAWAGVSLGVGVCLAAAPIPLLIVRRMRTQAARIAAAKYLATQAREGLSTEEATSRLEELAPDGVTIDTDDVPNTGLAWLGVLALGAIIAIVHAASAR